MGSDPRVRLPLHKGSLAPCSVDPSSQAPWFKGAEATILVGQG